MPAAASSPIPAVLVKLGPLDSGRIADLRPYFDSVPDPRARRGRWYSLTAILLVCACAAVSGARSIDELAEWGQRASTALPTAIGIRRHLLRWRRTPAPAAIGRVLGAVDGDALDRAVGAYLADRHRAATEPAQASSPSGFGPSRVIAVDGKALKGSARLTATRRHLLSAVTHGTVVTFDALHSVKSNISWLVADEPTTGQDVLTKRHVVDQLAAVARQGVAVIVLSHDLDVVRALADEVLVMRGGRIVEAAPAEHLWRAPRHPWTAELLAADGKTDDSPPVREGHAALQVRGLTARHRDGTGIREVVRIPELTLRSGECLAVVAAPAAARPRSPAAWPYSTGTTQAKSSSTAPRSRAACAPGPVNNWPRSSTSSRTRRPRSTNTDRSWTRWHAQRSAYEERTRERLLPMP